MRLLPRSLTGQIAALIAAALFVAQAVNVALLVNERRQLRFEQAVRPAVVRLTDAAVRVAAGRPLPGAQPGRRQGQQVSLVASDPIPPGLERVSAVEHAITAAFDDAGLRHGRVVTGVRAIQPDDPRFDDLDPRRAEQLRRRGGDLLVAVEQPGRGWLTLSVRWSRDTAQIVLRLIGQTLILYAVVLLAVLWLARRIARPLRDLTASAARFGREEDGPPLTPSGPADVRALITAFEGLKLRVGAMLDEKDRMLGAIGHDLRTPLAALRVRIESVEDDTDRARMADTIDEMSRTLDDILSLARLGRPSEPRTAVDLGALVDAVVDDFRDLGADVAFPDPPRLVRTVRPALMRRAVRNLIENAVRYAGAAEVSLEVAAGETRIVVADRGPGIAAEQLERVFDSFTRLEAARNRETGGAGLGLALARGIVREAGGDVALSNRPGGGLTAAIVLPD